MFKPCSCQLPVCSSFWSLFWLAGQDIYCGAQQELRWKTQVMGLANRGNQDASEHPATSEAAREKAKKHQKSQPRVRGIVYTSEIQALVSKPHFPTVLSFGRGKPEGLPEGGTSLGDWSSGGQSFAASQPFWAVLTEGPLSA